MDDITTKLVSTLLIQAADEDASGVLIRRFKSSSSLVDLSEVYEGRLPVAKNGVEVRFWKDGWQFSADLEELEIKQSSRQATVMPRSCHQPILDWLASFALNWPEQPHQLPFETTFTFQEAADGKAVTLPLWLLPTGDDEPSTAWVALDQPARRQLRDCYISKQPVSN